MLTYLQVELLINVLSRLPAKTLTCLKIVCKLWCDLISDDYFVDYHLERSLATETNLHYLVSTPRVYLQKYDHLPEPQQRNCAVLFSGDFDTLENPIELHHPFKNCKTGVWVVGSCRGLVLLHITDGHLLLYNPTTQTYNVLPRLPEFEKLSPGVHFDFGFGYDNVSKDYKCVRIMQFWDKYAWDFVYEVMIYSLNAKRWKGSSGVPCYFRTYNLSIGILVRELLHWIGTNIEYMYECIVAFNLRDEMFSCLPLPNYHFEQSDSLYVGALDDCLCILANRYTDNNWFLRCDVWVMKEYGVAGSWTKMSTFEKLSCLNVERPIGYSMNKKRFLMMTCLYKLINLDLETKDATEVTFADWDRGLDAHVYVDNFLVLDHAGADDTHAG